MIVSKVVLAMSVGLPLIGSIAVRTNSQSLWSLLNHYQLILMLPLLDTYLPDQFVYFVREFQFVLLDFSFTDFMTIQPLKKLVGKLDYEQPQSFLSEIDLDSGSHIVNQFNNAQIFFVLIFINVTLLGVYYLLKIQFKRYK